MCVLTQGLCKIFTESLHKSPYTRLHKILSQGSFKRQQLASHKAFFSEGMCNRYLCKGFAKMACVSLRVLSKGLCWSRSTKTPLVSVFKTIPFFYAIRVIDTALSLRL